MKKNLVAKYCVEVIFNTALITGGMYLGYCYGYEDCKKEAVKNNVAHYVPDGDGRPKFEWKAKL